jgi:hypothetical protein
VRFKLYKALGDEVGTALLEGEIQYSLAELKSSHGIEQDNGKYYLRNLINDRPMSDVGFSVLLPPSSVSLSVRLMPSQNEERFESAFQSFC